jgi:periplasmic protein TonB
VPATTTTVSDRLGSTLFVAALAHGIVILGVTFAGSSSEESDAMPSLDVTLVVDRDESVPADDTARWIAQRNERGSGRPNDALRPTTVLAANQPLTLAGDPSGADLEDRAPHEPTESAPALATRAPAEQQRPRTASEASAPEPMRAAALLDKVPPRTRAAEIDLSAYLPDEPTQDPAFLSPATRASNLAQYLDDWRRRVERIGTVNFPAQFRGERAPGRPTLEVTIGADGDLEDIVVRKSSGNHVLDQAALDILRMAAPFPPLPEAVRAEYDVLRFAYEWDFLGADEPAADDAAGESPN